MSDKKHKADPQNPFSALNAAQFPSERSKKGTVKRPATSKQRATSNAMSPDSISGDSISGDAELFLRAMSSVTVKSKDSPSENRAGQHPAPEKDDASLFAEAMRQSAQKKQSGSAGDKTGGGSAPSGKENRPVPSSTLDSGTALLMEAVGLTDQDTESTAFFQAVKGAAPLSGKGRDVPPEPEIPATPLTVQSNPLQDILDGKLEFALTSSDEYVEGHVVGLDALTIGKLQARQYSPEMHIDLHGLNSEQAYHNLAHFFRGAYHKGVRTVLVITGRGLNSPDGMPVLRHKVQQWLVHEPFRRAVLAFCTAKREDGGAGALYVLLRKYRKNSGKIYWDALPADPDFFL